MDPLGAKLSIFARRLTIAFMAWPECKVRKCVVSGHWSRPGTFKTCSAAMEFEMGHRKGTPSFSRPPKGDTQPFNSLHDLCRAVLAQNASRLPVLQLVFIGDYQQLFLVPDSYALAVSNVGCRVSQSARRGLHTRSGFGCRKPMEYPRRQCFQMTFAASERCRGQSFVFDGP